MMRSHNTIPRVSGRLVSIGFSECENMYMPETVGKRAKRVHRVGCIYLDNSSRHLFFFFFSEKAEG